MCLLLLAGAIAHNQIWTEMKALWKDWFNTERTVDIHAHSWGNKFFLQQNNENAPRKQRFPFAHSMPPIHLSHLCKNTHFHFHPCSLKGKMFAFKLLYWLKKKKGWGGMTLMCVQLNFHCSNALIQVPHTFSFNLLSQQPRGWHRFQAAPRWKEARLHGKSVYSYGKINSSDDEATTSKKKKKLLQYDR